MEKNYSRTTERFFLKISLKQLEDAILTHSFKKIFAKFLSVVYEYFFPIFLKTMNNELGNYAKS